MIAGLAVVRNTLPAEVSSFVGREHELGEITRLLRTHRLVTLTGAGGTGKTRLALRAAAAEMGQHDDGICLVELAPLATPDLVIDALVKGIGAPETGSALPLDSLAAFLGQKQMLLVVDN